MPLAWRSAARSNASPHSCASGDPAARLGGPVTEAFADRIPIDWTALLRRVRHPGDRGLVEALRSVDALRCHLRGAAAAPIARPRLVRALVLVAILQIACALAAATTTVAAAQPFHGAVHHVLLVLAFGAASLVLAAATPREPRAIALLATLLFSGAAFARAALNGLPAAMPGLSSALFRGLYPEALAPAALWQFAVLFPDVKRFTTFDRIARRAAAIASASSALLFVANFLLAYGIAGAPLRLLWRDDPGNLFWHAFVVVACPAVATIFIRAYRADHRERRKVLRFAAAIATGTAPFLVTGLARMTLPAADRWMLGSDSVARTIVDVLVLAALAGMPLLAAVAVVLDRPFDAAPTVLHALNARRAVSRCLRSRLLSWPSIRQAERLTDALERVRLARGSGEIIPLVARELRFGLHASTVLVVDPAALPRQTALLAMLEESSGPLDLSRAREPFVLLPECDRDWLEGNDVVLAAPLCRGRGPTAAVVLLGHRRDGAPWRPADRWFIRTLLTGAAAAWDGGAGRHPSDNSDAAFECALCGRVAHLAAACCHGATMIRSALPRTIGGKFTTIRRLGRGGSGVVYLAHDSRLDRRVALKTLPPARKGIGDLRDEARAMATLNHDSLATIYGLELWRRTPVLVVEYFPLGTLAERLKHGPMPLREVVALGMRIADGLCYMHDRGLLHRDLKPSNIGFTADGAAKVFDFGLAVEAATAAGTPAYLPPEALAGGDADVHVDLWGLATVIREAAGGGRDVAELLRPFLSRALATDPKDRFGSASDVHAALARIASAGGDRPPPHDLTTRADAL